MTPTTPPPGQALTAETALLANRGDLLRADENCFGQNATIRAGGAITFEKVEAGAIYYCGDLWEPSRFTFIGRPDTDGWIAWSGGDNPVPGQMVEVRARGGRVRYGASDVFHRSRMWEHSDFEPDKDVIAFRLASQSTAPTRGEGEQASFGQIGKSLYEAFWSRNGGNAPTWEDQARAIRTMWMNIARDASSAFTAPTPPEPVASALAEGEVMKISDVLDVLRADRLPECSFDEGRTWETDDVIVAETFSRAADTLEAAAARIDSLESLLEQAGRYQAEFRDRATQAEARADRLAKALEPFAYFARHGTSKEYIASDAPDDGLCAAASFPAGAFRAVLEAAEALRDPKSGGE